MSVFLVEGVICGILVFIVIVYLICSSCISSKVEEYKRQIDQKAKEHQKRVEENLEHERKRIIKTIDRADDYKRHVEAELESKQDKLLSEVRKREKEAADAIDNANEQRQEAIKLEKECAERLIALNRREKGLNQKEANLNQKEEYYKRLSTEQDSSHKWLAELYADIEYVLDEDAVTYLREKKHPAFTAAENLKRCALEKRELNILYKALSYQIKLYEALFPWLENYREISIQDISEISQAEAEAEAKPDSEYETVKNWLSPDEYNALPSADKWQLALERYQKRKKSNWQVGIEYERYIGYLYEQKGYIVHYNGALEGLADMGRDIIAVKGERCVVIQCKRWAREKLIHENHIFQLYGTVVLERLKAKYSQVDGVLISTTTFSDVAQQCASVLGVQLVPNYALKDYPSIKCNVGKDGELIYHMPFDQQYDRIMLRPKDGDCYVSTAREAEAMGFRHAFHWHGTS